MKANEFVKKYGLSSFKAAMACPQFARYKYTIIYSDEIDFSNELIEKRADYMFNTSEVKRLVESHELVEKLGGIKNTKRKLSTEQSEPYYNYSRQLVDSLKQAIADVESCMEMPSESN